MCEVSTRFLHGEFLTIVRETRNEQPICQTYSSDATPMLTQQHWVRKLGNTTLKRRGKSCQEFLVERTFVQGRSLEGRPMLAVRFGEPMSLTEGKDGWALLACLMRSAPTLRSLGCKALCVPHYVWDRGCYSVLSRYVRQLHTQEAQDSCSPAKVIEELTDWVVTNADPCHDCSNALLLALKPFMPDPDTAKSMFIGIASMRNAYDLIMMHSGPWLREVVAFVPEDGSADHYTELWALLGVQAAVAGELVERKLCVLEEHRGDPATFARVATALVGVWRFVKFSETRWLTFGPSCRAIIASHLTGIGSLIGRIRQDP